MLVGREQELNVLNTSLQEMLDGKGNVLFLAGEAGLGKTTLVHEWWKTVSSPALYLEGDCSIPIGNMDVGKLEALQPWADIVAQLHEHEHTGEKKLDLKRLIHDAAPAWAWAIPFIGDIAHAAVETHRLIKEQRGEMNPNAANQQQVFQQYVNLLVKVSEHSPLVILLDDMHWGDASSTNLLFYLSRQITNKRIFVIVAYRPDEAIAENNGEGHPILKIKSEILRYGGKECSLTFLGDAAIRELLASSFSRYITDDRFEHWLRKISDGNSLFVTQFIKTLREDGNLTAEGAFRGNYESVTIPDSALAVVTERTRRLDEPTRELLHYATAEGEEFTSYVLGRLTEKKPLELLKELKTASKLGIIIEHGSTRIFANQTTTLFGFSHALFHKALYDSMLEGEREILHRQCYEILKVEWDRLTKTEDRTNSLASKLLAHAEKCGEIAVAAEVALEAAKGAWQTFAESESMEMLGSVKRLLNSKGSLPDTKRNNLLGETALLQSKIDSLRGRYNDALNAAADALKYFERSNDEKKIIETVNQRSWVLSRQSAYVESKTEAHKALTLAEKAGDKYGVARAFNNIGNAAWYLSVYNEALEHYTRSLTIAESLGSHTVIASSLNNIGNVYINLGVSEKALEHHRRSLEIRESIGDRVGIVTSLNNIGNVYLSLETFDDALDYYKRSLEMAESLGDRQGIARTLNNIGAVHQYRKAYDVSLEYYKQSLTIRELIGDRDGIAISLNNIGSLHRMRGDWEQARKSLEKALSIAHETGGLYFQAYALCELGLVAELESGSLDGHARRSKTDEAIAHLTKGVSMLREINHNQLQLYEKELERIKGTANGDHV
jgi:tetratricopeptide (TPR) repeat protein